MIGIEETPVEQEPRSATAATQPIPVGDAVMPQCPQPLEGWVTKCIFGATLGHTGTDVAGRKRGTKLGADVL